MSTIAFIGAGNMAGSILGGLIKQGMDGNRITASDPKPDMLEALARTYGIQTTTDNHAAAANADILVLAVKPQVMGPVCQDLAEHIRPGTLVISIAAGITCASLEKWLGANTALVRCMPNTPALVQQGATGLFANSHTTETQKQLADQVMSSVGTVCWVEQEPLIDAVTALSGSGPAYFFLMLEAMVNTAQEQGLSPETARSLAIQTAAGAAKLAAESDVDLAELRRRVTSPGGTTEQAILTFEKHQFRSAVAAAMGACRTRAEQLAEELGQN